MSLENTNKLKATNFVGRGLEFNVSPEQRDLLEMMTPDQRELLKAQKYYEIRDDKPLTQELTKKIIEQEYGAGATAKLANVENAKPFEHATVFDALEGVTAEPIKLKSSVSDTEDPVDALMDHILKDEGYEKIDITKPYSVSLVEVGVDENGAKVFEEVITPHFPLGKFIAESEAYLQSISTAEGEELEVAQRIEDMPLGRFSASAFNTFFPVDVPTLPAETTFDKVQDVTGAIVGFSALLALPVGGDPTKAARGLGKFDPKTVSIPGRASATGVRAIPGLNTIITKANQHNPVLGRIVENSFNYAAAGGGLGLYSTIGADMTAEQRVEVTLKGAAFGLANVYGRELYALNTVLGKAGAIATVGGTGMALAPEGSTPTERLAYGAVSIVLFGIANGLSNSQATKNAENWMKTQSQNSRSGLSVDNIKYFLSAVFNQQKYARTRTYADRLDLFARQTEAAQVKFIPGRPLAEPKKPAAPKPTQKVETLPPAAKPTPTTKTLPPATKPAPVPATKKQLPSVADDVELTLAKGREAIKRADELLARLNQVVNTAPTLANIKQVNKTMTTQQISALAPKVEPKPKGRKLLLNMYNNPTQRNLDAYIKYKYSDLYKPAEELELKPTERIELPEAEPVQPPVVKMESDVKGVPPPENAQKTQVATTVPTYQKSEAILNDLAPGQTLDFGAGRGKGGEAIGAKTYEPYPREGFSPDFTDSSAIPSSSFEKIISPSVLNVVPKDVRDNIVSEIGRILKPNGAAIITVRSTTDVKKAKVKEKHPSEENAFIVGPTLEQATFQKGFTEKELIDYLSGQLGDGFEVTPIPKVEGKPKPSGVGALIRKSEAAVAEPAVKPTTAEDEKIAMLEKQKKEMLYKRENVKTVYQGRGFTKEQIYTDTQTPVLGEGQYYAFTRDEASNYGDKITESSVDISNLYQLDGESFNSLLKELKESNPNLLPDIVDNKDRTELSLSFRYREQLDQSPEIAQKLKELIISKGYNGFIIRGIENELINPKSFRNMLGHNQIVVYPEATPIVEPAPVGTGIEEPVQVGAGFTQAQRDMELEALRVRDIEKIMGYRIPKDQMDAWDSVIGAARSDGFVDRALINAQRIIDLNIAHTDKEFVGFLIRAREIQAERSALQDELNEYIADGEDATFLIQELTALEKELNTISQASAVGGKQVALALQIRRMTLADSYAYEDVLSRYIGASNNNTKEEIKQDLQIKTEKIKELDEEEQQLVNEATRKEAEDALEEIKTGKRKPAKRNKANLEKDIKRGLSEGIIEAAQIYRYFAELVRDGEISKLDQGVKIISKMLPDLTEQEILNAISKRSKSVDAVPEGVELTLKQLRKQARLTAQFNDAVKGIFDPERPTLPSTDEIRHFERAVKMLKAYYEKNLPATAERRKLFDRIRDAEDQVNKHYRNIPLPKKNDPKIKNLNKQLNTVKNLIAQTDTLYDLELTTSVQSKIDIIDGMINRDPHEAIDMIRDFVKEINLIYYPRVKHARTPRKEAKPDEKVIPLMQRKIDDLMEELIFQTKTTKPIPEGKPLTTPAQQKKGAELKAAKDAIKLREKVFELSEKLGVKKPAIPLRTTNEQLRDKVNDLNELIKIYNPPTQSQAKKIENLNKRLLEVDKEIEGMYRKYKKPLAADDPQVVLLRKRLAQETSVRRLLDEIADLEEQLNTGQFKSKYSYKPQLVNKRLDDLRTQRAILKNQVDGAIAKAVSDNKQELIEEFFNATSSMVLSLDVGQIGRQGAYAWAVPSDIVTSLRAGGQSLGMLLKPENVEKTYAMIRRDEDFGLAELVKLQLPNPDAVRLGEREELAVGKLIGKIPGIKLTSRAQVAGTALLRFGLFKNMLRDNPDASMEEIKFMAKAINMLTGYGSGELLGRDVNLLDNVLISKRFTESRMQIPLATTPLPKWMGGGYYRGEEARKARAYFHKRINGTIAKNILLGVLAVEAIPGADFGRNPDHWTFGKLILPVGGGYYAVVDLFGGVLNFTRVAINTARAAGSFAYNKITGRDDEIYGAIGAEDWFNELSKRANPGINLISRVTSGTKYPNEPVSTGEAAARSISPIIAEEIYTSVTERKGITNPVAEFGVVAANFLGASTVVLPRKTVFGKNNENVRLPEDIRRLIQF